MPSVVDSGRALNFSAQTFEQKAVIGVAIKDHTPYQIQEGTGSQFVLTDPNSKLTPLEVPGNIDFLDQGLEGVYVDPLLGYGHSAIQDARAMINQINDILMDSRVMNDPYASYEDAVENRGIDYYHVGNVETFYYNDGYGGFESVLEITQNDDGTRTKIFKDFGRGFGSFLSNLWSGWKVTEIQVQTDDGSWETIYEEGDGLKSWLNGLFECFPPVPPPIYFDNNGESQDGIPFAEIQMLSPFETTKFDLV